MQPYFCSNCNQYHHTKQPKKSSGETIQYLKFSELLNHAPSPHEQNFAVNSPSLPKRSAFVYADVSVDCEFPQNIAEKKFNKPQPFQNHFAWTNKKSKQNGRNKNENQTTTYSTENSKSPEKKTMSTEKKNAKKKSFGSKAEKKDLIPELKKQFNEPPKPKIKEGKLICEQVHCLTKESEVITKGKNKYFTDEKQNSMKNELKESKNCQYSSVASKNMAQYATNYTHTSSFDSASKTKEESKVMHENELIKKRNENIVLTMSRLREDLEKNKKNVSSKDSQSEASFSFGNDKEKRVLKVLSKIEEHCCNKEKKENGNQKKNNCSFYDNRCFGLSLCMENEVKCVDGPHQLL